MAPATQGGRAERSALWYLLRHGLWPLARNYRCRHGELDLIMRHGATLVFIEVRLRNHPGFGDGLMSITHRKRRCIVRSARHYLQRHSKHRRRGVRFDVVAVTRSGCCFRHRWTRNAFGMDESSTDAWPALR